jgi:hypothetical protein
VRWLFAIGLALDLAGAALIAWTIYSQTAAETREEAHTRWGGNFWLLLFRLREQAYVRAGMALVAAGFTLQLVGYLVDFGWPTGLLAGVVAVATAAVAFAAARRFADRAVPFDYAQELDLPAGQKTSATSIACERSMTSKCGGGSTPRGSSDGRSRRETSRRPPM